MMADNVGVNVLGLTVQIVSAHVRKNKLTADALLSLIQTVHRSLASVGRASTGAAEPEPKLQVPAVPVKKSVFPDFIICLEDGKRMKMLKRHLRASYNMTPGEYRAKWKLPDDYPMVAPSYASQRSNLAKSFGLGRKRAVGPDVTIVPARRAKGSKG